MLLKNIMYKTKMLADFLQGENIDMPGAVIAMESTLASLKRLRSSDNEVSDEIAAAMIFAKSLGIDPDSDFLRLHRARRIPRRLDDRPETASTEIHTVEVYYKSQFFIFMDTLINDLEDKLELVKDTFDCFLTVLEPEKSGTVDDTKSLLERFPAAFTEESSTAIHNELEIFKRHIQVDRKKTEKEKSEDSTVGPMTISEARYQALKYSRDHFLFTSVVKLYQLFLTAAPSVCKNEQSFSALRRVKNYLRNSMSGDRLNDCMLLIHEKDITDQVDLKRIAKKWAMLKNRREKINENFEATL